MVLDRFVVCPVRMLVSTSSEGRIDLYASDFAMIVRALCHQSGNHVGPSKIAAENAQGLKSPAGQVESRFGV